MLENSKLRDLIYLFLKSIPKNNYYLFLIILASFIIRVIYVFYFTHYKTYLITDMGNYWNAGLNWYNEKGLSRADWMPWTPIFPIYLSNLFKVISFLNLYDYKLEIVLFLNIIYSTVSVYFFYLISTYILKNTHYSLIVTALYAFNYIVIYFNSLVLTENVALPMFIISVYLLFAYSESRLITFLNGVFFGLAVAIRLAFGIIALPFFLYVVLAKKFSVNSLFRGILFALGFFIVIFFVAVENNHVSQGKYKGLSPHGAVNFLIAQCKAPTFISNYKGYVYSLSDGYFSLEKDLVKQEKIETDHPIYDQKYFYQLGIDCIKKDPSTLIGNFIHLRALIFRDLHPSFLDAKGFNYFWHLTQYTVFFMVLSLGMFYYLFKGSSEAIISNKPLLFIISVLACTVFMAYFFLPASRYFVPVYFILYLLFFTIISHIKDYKQQFINYIRTLVLVYFIYLFFC